MGKKSTPPLILIKYDEGHDGRVEDICIDDKFIYSGSYDNTIRVWDKKSLKTVAVLWGFLEHSIWTITCDLKYIYSGGWKIIQIWRKENFQFIKSIEEHESVITKLFVDDKYLYSASHDGTVRVWDKEEFKQIKILKLPNQEFTCVFVDDKFIYASTDKSVIIVWEKLTFQEITQVDLKAGHIFYIFVDGNLLYAACSDNLQVRKKDTLEMIHELTGHTSPILDIVVDTQYIYTSSSDRTLRVWEKSTFNLINTLKLIPLGWIQCLADDKKRLYGGSVDYGLFYWSKSRGFSQRKRAYEIGESLGPRVFSRFNAFADHKFIYFSNIHRDFLSIDILDRKILQVKSIEIINPAGWSGDIFSDDKYIFIVYDNHKDIDIFDIEGFVKVKTLKIKDFDYEEKKRIIKENNIFLPILVFGDTRNVIARFNNEELSHLNKLSLLLSKGIVIEDQYPEALVIVPEQTFNEEILARLPPEFVEKIKACRDTLLSF